MFVLPKETALRFSSILFSSYYKKWVRYFETVLRATRNAKYRNNPKVLLSIQYRIAKTETLFWTMLREGRAKAKELNDKQKLSQLSDKEIKTLRGLEQHIFIHEQLIRISRTICDGIAWRNLNYNRTFLSSTSRGNSAGDMDSNSPEFKSELIWAHRISEHFGTVVLLNDLTRFLRIGDLTEIQDKVPFIHEIKKYGKEVKNIFTLRNVKGKAKVSEQGKRLLELQRIAIYNEAIIGNSKVKTNKFNTVLKTNLPILKKLIKESNEKIIVSKEIEPYLTLEITNFEAYDNNRKHIDIQQLQKETLKLTPQGLSLSHSNWDTFYTDEKGNFVRSTPPYSIFPLSVKDCLRLMSGQYLVVTTIDIKKLNEFLTEHNWKVDEVTESELDKEIGIFDSAKSTMFSVKNSLYDFSPEEAGILKISRGPFSMNLTTTFYARITMEFMSGETLLELLEEIYQNASKEKKPIMFFPQLTGEESSWN